VTTNDPANEKVQLDMKGKVTMLLGVDPKILDFKNVFVGESKTLPVEVSALTGLDFKILDVECSGTQFEAFVGRGSNAGYALKQILDSARQRIVDRFGSHDHPANPAGKKRPDAHAHKTQAPAPARNIKIVTVRVLPTAQVGRHSGVLTIHTDLNEKPKLEVRIMANVEGNIIVEPKTCFLGPVKHGERGEGSFTITSRNRTPFSITEVKADRDDVTAELSVLKPGSEYKLEVGVLPNAPLGLLYATAVLQTTDKDQPELKLKFHANIVE
jgi:hypothetical protein